MSHHLIEIRNLSYRINGCTILDDLSFDICKGEYLSIIGPNGAGKTTLLQICNRIRKGGEGTVRIKGKKLSAYRQKDIARVIAYVPQASQQQFPFTVYEFLLMGRYPYLGPFSSPAKEDRRVVEEMTTLTGIEPVIHRTMNSLSGGEHQKVLIAAALCQDTPVLFLDEPTTFLDPHHQAEIFKILHTINRDKQVTVISVMHDLNNAVLTSGKIMALQSGKIKYMGPAGGVVQEDILREIYRKPFRFFNDPETGKRLVVPEGAL